MENTLKTEQHLCLKRRGDTRQEEAVKRHHTASPPTTLHVQESLYDAAFPFYKQPLEVGRFSLDATRNFFNDSRQLRYYSPPPPGDSPQFDLRDGYRDRYVKRDDSIKERLDHLLQWIQQNQSVLRAGAASSETTTSSWLNKDFVTWRGHLTKVLTTPYEKQEGWLLAVTHFRGTYYISEVETEAARRQREERTAAQEELMYMGYKFEQYLCAATPGGIPDTGGVVNTNEAFCTVVQTKLNGHSLLFAGEVDCADPKYPSQKAPDCYVELKTSKEIHSANQQRSFNRYKLIKWWAQSFLPGVPRIVAGFRNEEGIVASLKTFETMKISHMIRGDWNSWKPAVCMNFCNAFLSFVKKVAIQDDPQLVYLFSWEPGSDVSYSVHKEPTLTFVPAWYVQLITQLET
ncbi:decapping and exoribonuclease protein isoform X1 [Microcaecilia unicolor]|uniref:Decapping nuclease n=1 Tax=Microcaecilia unicolor TaxID=1415580 RepID=A0A6P7XRX5_9AMPH|nr:decapping and exoribonuclease protein isoform X1 [Microcaecilia unicolor]XP_030053195.1 decapping and exoribonuclease protein isoform X1 [Microcaecilia unicolor]XP_030053196.1 decapping and exoribonuclease protein isoform X1 [Microcaecilia unicolor]XP_030053198.1 decapping and exoribonuclease protein isoform X1 [Microcaecilia unicolor]